MTTIPLFPAQLIAWGIAPPQALRWLLDEVIRQRKRALVAGHLERAREIAEALLNGGLTVNDPVAVVQPDGAAFRLLTAHPVRMHSPPLSPITAMDMALNHRGAVYVLAAIQDGLDLHALLQANRPWIGVLEASDGDLTALTTQTAEWLGLDEETTRRLLHQGTDVVILVDEQRITAVWKSQPDGWTLAWKG